MPRSFRRCFEVISNEIWMCLRGQLPQEDDDVYSPRNRHRTTQNGYVALPTRVDDIEPPATFAGLTHVDNVPLPSPNYDNIDEDFKITIVNNTGEGERPGRDVNVMLFQTFPDSLMAISETCAWKVRDVPFPGELGPIDLPGNVKFYVIDHPDGEPRPTGPFEVNFGDAVDVTQKTKDEAPCVEVVASAKLQGEIKANNVSGNVQPLEMALFKSGSKIVSFKDVKPADSVYLAIKPAIYIADVEGKLQEQDFGAATQATRSTEFKLIAGNPNVKIEITQLPSGELVFSKP